MPQHTRPVFSAAIRVDPAPRKVIEHKLAAVGEVGQGVLKHGRRFDGRMVLPTPPQGRSNRRTLKCNQSGMLLSADQKIIDADQGLAKTDYRMVLRSSPWSRKTAAHGPTVRSQSAGGAGAEVR
jgi:hypothetical protein